MGFNKARSKVGFPKSVTINNVTYPCLVLRETSRDGDDCPRTFELLRPDEAANVGDGPEPARFWVVYGPPNMIPERKN